MLAHELSHVAHRDVLVMTLASSAGIIAGMLTRGAQYGGFGGGGRRGNNNGGAAVCARSRSLVSLVVYAISFFLTRLLSRYRELCADRVGRVPDPEAVRAGQRAAPRSPARSPRSRPRTCARPQPMNAFFIAPAISGVDASRRSPRPTRRSSSGSSSSPRWRPSSASRWTVASRPRA